MDFKTIFFNCGFLLCLALNVQGQKISLPKHYVCYKAASSLKIDGKADEKSWQMADWTDDFVDITGNQQSPPRFRTRTKMLWDTKYFYVFAEIYEPHIWANLRQRDTVIYLNNDFEVFIDPDGDTHKYFEFEVNALNTQWDLLLTKPYRDGGIPITTWNFDKMISAVSIDGTINNPSDTDRMWGVEIAFPLKSLGDSSAVVPVRQGDQWRVNFSRVEWQASVQNGQYFKKVNPKTGKRLPEDNWVWSPQGSVNMHIPDKWGYVQFSDIICGKGTAAFISNLEDEVKDELRILYYSQKRHHISYQRYASAITDLDGMDDYKSSELKFNPEIKLTSGGYEVTAKQTASDKIWHINESGKVWAEKNH